MRLVLYILGFLCTCLGGFMLLPLAVAFYYGGPDRGPLALSVVLTVATGGGLLWAFRSHPQDLNHREAFLAVTGTWLLAAFFGALPYQFAGVMRGFVDCLFESVSGFTTTGATILTDIEALPRGLLFWRSLTQWLGGMGIIVLGVAVLPLLGVGGMQLYKAEAPGTILPDKVAPRVMVIARSLWWIYLVLSLAQTFLLMAGGMSLYEGLCHTFTTMSTGGFSTRNASIAAYQNPFLHWVITLFMLAAGTNFVLHLQAMRGALGAYRKDSEFRLFALIFSVGLVLITLDLWSHGFSLRLRDAVFQTASILTTTGYATADFETWPTLSRFLLLVLMVVGGSAGSTAGGVKCLRILILLKAGYRELVKLVHPRAVVPVRVGDRPVPDEAVSSVTGFFCCYAVLFGLTATVLAGQGVDLETAFSATLACIGNVGPGLGAVGPTDNFAWMPAFAKLLLCACMMLGRLEIYSVLVLLTPAYWKR